MLIKDILLEDVLFYQIDRTIKLARAYTVKAFTEAGYDLTVDQWLILKKLSDQDGAFTQTELAQSLTKDNASITRTIDLMVKKKLLKRQRKASDRRAYELALTESGSQVVAELLPIVKQIREKALEDLSTSELEQVRQTLQHIQENLS